MAVECENEWQHPHSILDILDKLQGPLLIIKCVLRPPHARPGSITLAHNGALKACRNRIAIQRLYYRNRGSVMS